MRGSTPFSSTVRLVSLLSSLWWYHALDPSSPVGLHQRSTIYGRGENHARQQPMLTTATLVGAMSSLEAWPWPKLCLPISVAGENPRSGSPVWATAAPRRRSLLEDVILVTRFWARQVFCCLVVVAGVL
jgi:hypothetical protein